MCIISCSSGILRRILSMHIHTLQPAYIVWLSALITHVAPVTMVHIFTLAAVADSPLAIVIMVMVMVMAVVAAAPI